MEDMKTKTIICVAGLLCAVIAASFWLVYQHGRSSTSDTLRESSPPRDTATAWEHKTVEFQTDLRQQMSEWQREGWVVLNVSGSITQKDGTIARKASLKRAKQ